MSTNRAILVGTIETAPYEVGEDPEVPVTRFVLRVQNAGYTPNVRSPQDGLFEITCVGRTADTVLVEFEEGQIVGVSGHLRLHRERCSGDYRYGIDATEVKALGPRRPEIMPEAPVVARVELGTAPTRPSAWLRGLWERMVS